MARSAGQSAVLRAGDFAAWRPVSLMFAQDRGAQPALLLKGRGTDMETTTILQIVCGVLAVVVLFVLIQRRRTRVK